MSWSHLNQFVEHVRRCDKPLCAWINKYGTLCWDYKYPHGDFHINIGCYQRDSFHRGRFIENFEEALPKHIPIEEYL